MIYGDLVCVPCIGWEPSSSDYLLWLDASDLDTITKDVSDLVSAWADKSSKGNNAIQEKIDIYKPKYEAAALNGKPALDMGHEGSNLEFMYILSDISPTKQDYTMFFVLQDDAAVGPGNIRSIFGSPRSNPAQTGTEFIHLWGGGSPPEENAWIMETDTLGATQRCGIVGLNPQIVAFRMNSSSTSSASIRKNGSVCGSNLEYVAEPIISLPWKESPIYSGPTTIAAWVQYGTIGAAGWKGVMSEILLAPGNLSTAMVQKVEGYLAWKWGLEDYLPSSHPYKKYKPS